VVVAGFVNVLFHRLKQPVVLGYIIAGVIIDPHTPPFPLIKDEHTIQTRTKSCYRAITCYSSGDATQLGAAKELLRVQD
jgi:hypothetical protein